MKKYTRLAEMPAFINFIQLVALMNKEILFKTIPGTKQLYMLYKNQSLYYGIYCLLLKLSIRGTHEKGTYISDNYCIVYAWMF